MIVEGILIYCMTWLGIVFSVEFISVVRPAIDRNGDFQPANLVLKLSIMYWKSFWLGRFTNNGNLRYFPKVVPSLILKDEITNCLSDKEVFLEKKIFNFWKLMLWPDIWLKMVNVSMMVCTAEVVKWDVNVISSTKNRWEMGGPFLESLMAFHY